MKMTCSYRYMYLGIGVFPGLLPYTVANMGLCIGVDGSRSKPRFSRGGCASKGLSTCIIALARFSFCFLISGLDCSGLEMVCHRAGCTCLSLKGHGQQRFTSLPPLQSLLLRTAPKRITLCILGSNNHHKFTCKQL